MAKAPPEKFDMSSWRCGSVCCAGGHACCDQKFKELGLRMEYDGDEDADGNKYYSPALPINKFGRDEYGLRYTREGALAKFFGVNEDEIYDITSSFESSQAEVAQMINQLADKYAAA